MASRYKLAMNYEETARRQSREDVSSEDNGSETNSDDEYEDGTNGQGLEDVGAVIYPSTRAATRASVCIIASAVTFPPLLKLIGFSSAVICPVAGDIRAGSYIGRAFEVPQLLELVGFSSSGVVLDSLAAVWQSAIGNVARESVFATLNKTRRAREVKWTAVALQVMQSLVEHWFQLMLKPQLLKKQLERILLQDARILNLQLKEAATLIQESQMQNTPLRRKLLQETQTLSTKAIGPAAKGVIRAGRDIDRALTVPQLLDLLRFSSSDVVAGSLAAAWQSAIANIEAENLSPRPASTEMADVGTGTAVALQMIQLLRKHLRAAEGDTGEGADIPSALEVPQLLELIGFPSSAIYPAAEGDTGEGADTSSALPVSQLLGLVGFVPSGVVPDSLAAAWQSNIGNVASGSIFAALTKTAMAKSGTKTADELQLMQLLVQQWLQLIQDPELLRKQLPIKLYQDSQILNKRL